MKGISELTGGTGQMDKNHLIKLKANRNHSVISEMFVRKILVLDNFINVSIYCSNNICRPLFMFQI